MKKYIATSLVLVGAASMFGAIVGLSVYKPSQFEDRKASTVQSTPVTTDTQTPNSPATATSTLQTTMTTQAATAPTPTSTPQPTATAYEQVPLDDQGNIDCKLTYSDGTTYQWHWQTVNSQGSWVEDGQGQNGHWVQSTAILGKCDNSTIGLPKAN